MTRRSRLLVAASLAACIALVLTVLPAAAQPRPGGPGQPPGPQGDDGRRGPRMEMPMPPPPPADSQALLTDLFQVTAQAVLDRDPTPLTERVVEGAVGVLDGQTYVFARAGGVLLVGLDEKPAAPAKAKLTPKGISVIGGGAVLVGDLATGAETRPLVGVAGWLGGAWRVLSIVMDPNLTETEKPPAEVQAMLDDLMGDGETGMQAALQYLGKGPALYAVALGDMAIVMPGAEAIRGQVAGWKAPTEVTPVGKTSVLAGKDCVVAWFDTQINNEGQQRLLHNVVVATRTADGWRLPVFAAAFEPGPEPQPGVGGPAAAPATEGEGETGAETVEPASPVGPI